MKIVQTALSAGRKESFAIMLCLALIASSFGRPSAGIAPDLAAGEISGQPTSSPGGNLSLRPGRASGPTTCNAPLRPGDTLKKIAPQLLREDFTAFRDSLQRLHPGLYRYRDKTELDRIFDSCFTSLTDSMTVVEYFRLISFLVGSVEDGHTECSLPSDVVDLLKSNAKFFPIQLRFIRDRAFVPCDTKDLPAGTEITAIDDIPARQLKDRLFALLPSDGAVQAGKYAKMNETHDPFIYLYYVAFGEKPAFTVRYKTNTGGLETIVLHAETLQNIQCLLTPCKPKKYLQLDIRQGGIAILTIKTFLNEWMKDTNEDFSDFLQSAFKEIKDKSIKKLIIDLRDNGGGQDTNGALLYSYLASQPFPYYTSLESTTRKFRKEDHPLLEIQSPHANNYEGKVWFIINGNGFSGTSEFGAIARSNRRGEFIGEETGGGYYGNTSGARTTIVLPNTRIRVNIPETKYVMAVRPAKYQDRGIIPDYEVIPTISDYIQHKDVQFEIALLLAGSGQ